MRILLQSIGTSEWIAGAHYLKNLVDSIRSIAPDQKFIMYGEFDEAFFQGKLKMDGQVAAIQHDNLKRKAQEILEVLKNVPQPKFKLLKSVGEIFGSEAKHQKTFEEIYQEQKAKELKDLEECFEISYLIEDRDVAALKPSISWIADFQHFRLPHFFSRQEVLSRDDSFLKKIASSTLVIVSSESVKKDFLDFCEIFGPKHKDKVRVLNFATPASEFPDFNKFANVVQKYHLPQKFYLLPNQFWAHKNHSVVIDAVEIAKKKYPELCVVMTGNTNDYRNPNYFQSLLGKIARSDVHQNIRILGLIPVDDLKVLMLSSLAVINPSLFEGWSTSVEECKTLNISLILSDIEVHREQKPNKGVFFKPGESEDLANILIQRWQSLVPTESEVKKSIDFAKFISVENSKRFAEGFLKIANEALEISKIAHQEIGV